MVIPAKQIANTIECNLQKQVENLTKVPKLVTILLGESSEQLSFVAIKERLADSLGMRFEFLHFPSVPLFAEFLKILEQKVADESVTGIIVQHPFPLEYDFAKVYSIIPLEKEIEGHKPGSAFHFPLSLSVLTGLKYVYSGQHTADSVMVNFDEDKSFFHSALKNKNIVIAGRGSTGGQPIAKDFTLANIPFTQIHSHSLNPDQLYRQADIIITAVGKKIITPQNIKDGVVLLNVGLRKEHGKLKGDYDEDEIADKSAFYSATPGGLGPIDVLYLYKNLIEATKLQS